MNEKCNRKRKETGEKGVGSIERGRRKELQKRKNKEEN